LQPSFVGQVNNSFDSFSLQKTLAIFIKTETVKITRKNCLTFVLKLHHFGQKRTLWIASITEFLTAQSKVCRDTFLKVPKTQDTF
jgi:hypothetical protein